MPVTLDADAAAVYKAFQEAGRPAYETLTPDEARAYYLAARLVDARGQEVAAWLSTPEQTVDRDLQRNQVCLITKQPLQPGTQYTVTVTAQVDGAEWKQKWSFTTRKGQ